MKTILSVQRAALLALALATASATTAFAQTTTTSSTTTPPTCPAGGKHHHNSILTPAEKAQLKAAHQAALAANPTLKTQGDTLKQKFATLKSQGKGTASPADWQALKTQKDTYQTQLRAAELAINPSLSTIFAKLDAAPKHGHHHSQ